jgi:hypothetical protein
MPNTHTGCALHVAGQRRTRTTCAYQGPKHRSQPTRPRGNHGDYTAPARKFSVPRDSRLTPRVRTDSPCLEDSPRRCAEDGMSAQKGSPGGDHFLLSLGFRPWRDARGYYEALLIYSPRVPWPRESARICSNRSLALGSEGLLGSPGPELRARFPRIHAKSAMVCYRGR